MTFFVKSTLMDPAIRQSLTRFGPLAADSVFIGEICPGCRSEFAPGNFVTLVALGPGSDLQERKKAAAGAAYSAVAIKAHWQCVTGEIPVAKL